MLAGWLRVAPHNINPRGYVAHAQLSHLKIYFLSQFGPQLMYSCTLTGSRAIGNLDCAKIITQVLIMSAE